MDIRFRPRLLAAGYSDDEVRTLIRTGGLTAVRRGAYVVGALPDDRAARHVLGVRAALENLADGSVASHVSAALVHRLPVWSVPLGRVHVTRHRVSGGRRGRVVHVHVAPLRPDEIVVVDGIPVTSVARTVVDMARWVSFERAVVIADAALRREGVDAEVLSAALARARGWPGTPRARRAVTFADGGSESVGESRSRVAVARAGLPAPVLQWDVCGRSGRWIGRVDFGWPDRRTVGEFDGEVKYGRLRPSGQDPGDVVFEEKRREDAIRNEDLGVVRWTWSELDTFAEIAARIRSRFRSA